MTGLQGARCLQVDGPTGRLLVAEHPAQQHCHIRKVVFGENNMGATQSYAHTYSCRIPPKSPICGFPQTNCLNHAVSEQLPLPAGCVRDMQLSSDGAQLLVAGTRWLNILHVCVMTPVPLQHAQSWPSQVGSGNTAASLAIPLQAWSCCWDAVDANAVHVGMQQGALLTFDVRHPAMPLTSHTPPAGVPPTPLHTLVAAPTGGLLTATYTAVVAWEGGAGGSQGSTTWQVGPAHIQLVVHYHNVFYFVHSLGCWWRRLHSAQPWLRMRAPSSHLCARAAAGILPPTLPTRWQTRGRHCSRAR